MEPYAFISYSHKDARRVKEIASGLKTNHNLWMDEKLRHGKEYDPEIIKAIDDCTAFLLFASRNYIASDYCTYEYNEAIAKGKPVYIVLLEENINWDSTKLGTKIRFQNQDKDMFLDNEHLIEELNDKNISDMYLCQTSEPSNYAIHHDLPKMRLPHQYGSQYTFMYRNKKNERIKLIGRDNELKKLNEFTSSEDMFAWTMIIGAAGTGKSKLCLEFAYKKHAEGWNIYFFNENFSKKNNDLPDIFNRNTLIILDYTLSYTTFISEYIARQYDQRTELKYKLRVLLVDRDYQTEEKKDEAMHSEVSSMEAKLAYSKAQEFFPFLSKNEAALKHSQYSSIPLFTMNKLSDGQLAEIMISYVHQTTGKQLAQHDAENLVKQLKKIDPECTRPLFALFIAEAWSQGKTLANMQDTLDIILSDEIEKRWLKQEESKRDEYAIKNAIKTIMSFATIRGTVQYDTITDIFKDDVATLCKNMKLDKEGLKNHLYRSRLIDKNNNVLAVRPDILGEYMVLFRMLEQPQSIKFLLPKEWYMDSSIRQFTSNMYVDFESNILQVTDIKNRLFLDSKQMETMSEKNLSTYVNAIIELGYRTKQASIAAVQTLSQYYDIKHDDEAASVLADALAKLIKEQDLEERTIAKDLMQKAYLEHNDPNMAAKYADFLDYFSQQQELSVRQEAAQEARSLYKDHPTDDVAYRLARVLGNLAYGQDSLPDLLETAQEARSLYKDHPTDGVAYWLAGALWILAASQDSLQDRLATAQEARSLYKDHPTDGVAYWLAGVLINLANINLANKQYFSARIAAVEVIRSLYMRHPTEKTADVLSLGLRNLAARTANLQADVIGISKQIASLFEVYPTSEIGERHAYVLDRVASNIANLTYVLGEYQKLVSLFPDNNSYKAKLEATKTSLKVLKTREKDEKRVEVCLSCARNYLENSTDKRLFRSKDVEKVHRHLDAYGHGTTANEILFGYDCSSLLGGVQGILFSETGFMSSYMNEGRRMVRFIDVNKVDKGKGYLVIQLKSGSRLGFDFRKGNAFLYGLLSTVVKEARIFNLT